MFFDSESKIVWKSILLWIVSQY